MTRTSTHPTIALCMIVRNEAEDLPGCLESIAGLFDEVHVVDTGSTDDTPAIARQLGATVHHFAWCDDFSAARNESLRHARAGWVLWLDADDRMEPAEVLKLRQLAAGPAKTAYYCLLSSIADTNMEKSACLQLRFFPRIPGVRFEGRVHEQVIYSLQRAGARFTASDARILHTGYADRQDTVGKFRRNLSLLELDLAEHPGDPMLWYHLAHSLNAVGERGRAIEAALHLIDATDCRTRNREMFLYTHAVLARLHEENGDLAAKESALQRVLREEPGYAPALFFLGEAAFLRGEAGRARELLLPVSRDGLKVGTMPLPWRPILHLTECYLGELDEREGRREDARVHFRRATDIMPENAPGWAYAGRVALELGEHDEARAALAQAVLHGEDSAGVHFNLGLAMLEGGDLVAAREEITRAIERDATLAPAWVNLGNIEVRQGRSGEAIAAYRQATRIAPAFSLAHLNLARALVLAGDPRAAEVEFEAALAGDEPLPEALGYLGDLAWARGDFGRARTLLETFVSLIPGRPTALLRLADSYLALGAPEAARAGYEAVLRMDPENPEAGERLALVPAQAAGLAG